MENAKDFFAAAAPWLAIGLTLAVFFARSAKKKKDEKSAPDYSAEGMCVGMCMGVALGSSIGTGIGISLGMLLGLVIGGSIKKKAKGAGEE